jgi:cation diffusion facilitator family transporter
MKKRNELEQSSPARSDKSIAMHVSVVSIVANVILSVFKLLTGIFARSGALISDSVHSLSDVFSTVIVMAGITIAARKADRDHPYGHERFECVASILLAMALFAVGIIIGVQGVKDIVSGSYGELETPGLLALVAAAVSIVVKEWMYWYTRAAAKKINSGALMADAWHHRSDAMSSVGALIGIAGARLGVPVMDPIASVVICVFIVKAAFDVFRDAIDKTVDKACDEQTIAEIENVIRSQNGVVRIDHLQTRMFGAKIYVDIEIAVDGSIELRYAHAIAEQVHNAVEKNFPLVKHCMVHVNPDDRDETDSNA